MTELSTLYQTDYSAWATRNAELLRAGRYAELDVEHLLAELSDMGKSEQHELENRLTILLAHLLKWEYQLTTLSARWREYKGDSWRATIIEQRNRLNTRLKKSPALNSLLAVTIIEAYAEAMQLASDETQLPIATFPPVCPYSIAQLLDKNYYPSTFDH
ncbi:hypothetical protein CKO12_08860 [Chromatium okenii]|uniref:DUF29 domain-containing protein n=1 Tax=Chromatium okenii TaxID=61644 RepID=UPI0019061861|nr:DUF29 domain-containing protein [Chromatium okenii]MBK1641978.1 hypothetical protein [Chromatium okenii]